MSWVKIDQDTCTACGLCVDRCDCFSETDGVVTAAANEETCSQCGHCVALCPTGSIEHLRMDMDNFIPLGPPVSFDPDEFVRFVRQRRSHRRWKDKPVPRQVMERLVDVCRYAPTGSNVQTVEIIVVQDPDRIQRLAELTVESFFKAREINRQRAEQYQARGMAAPEELTYQLERLDRICERRAADQAAGKDRVFHKAPVVMIFHSPTLTSTPKDNCVIAAQTVTLAAMTLGLESCYIGLFESASTYPPIVKELDLPPGHRVYGVLILGYPKVTYLRTVDRKPIQTRWF